MGLGGTEIGTGVNAPKGYSAVMVRHLSEVSGFSLTTASNLIEATSDTGIYLTWLIMPGKVNPVIPEMLNQVAYQVIGNDLGRNRQKHGPADAATDDVEGAAASG